MLFQSRCYHNGDIKYGEENTKINRRQLWKLTYLLTMFFITKCSEIRNVLMFRNSISVCFLKMELSVHAVFFLFSSPGRSPGRAIVLPLAAAVAALAKC